MVWRVNSIRWFARIISIPWAFWALFWTFFVSAHYYGEGGQWATQPFFIIIMVVVALMYIGAAIIASVWGKEAFGGIVLIAEGILISVFIVLVMFATGDPLAFFRLLWLLPLAFSTLVVPPFLSGYLFLKCSRTSELSW